MFEGDSADMCAGKFPLVSMGGRAEGLACATRERGPPSALAEILIINSSGLIFITLALGPFKRFPLVLKCVNASNLLRMISVSVN